MRTSAVLSSHIGERGQLPLAHQVADLRDQVGLFTA
jgi:hypothetical protein